MRRPSRGRGLALHPLVEVRQRRSAGCGPRAARGVPGRLRGRRWEPAGSGLPPVVGGDGQRQMGGDLRPTGSGPSHRPPPKPRAGVARPPDLRARVGSPGADPLTQTARMRPSCSTRWRSSCSPTSASGRRASSASRSSWPRISARSSGESFAPAPSRCERIWRSCSTSRARAAPREPSDAELREAVRSAESEPARRVRAGALDGSLDQVASRLAEHVRRKLDIARPDYAG